jgi:hypothetical protein
MKAYLLCLAAFITINFCSAEAQEVKGKIPAASTGQRIEQDFGLGTISVKYYRPNTKGRTIFGVIEPYGNVWRTGANNSTVITTTDTIQIEGNTLLPGSYSLFSIPDPNEWTIIVNKNTTQWGAYSYNEKEDLFRFKVKPVKLNKKIETLTIQFADVKEESAVMQIQWDNTGIDLRLTTKAADRIWANIQEAMKTNNTPAFAAIWLYNHDRNLDQALKLMQEADKAQPNTFHVKYWLGKIYLKMGDKQSAIANANESLKLSTAIKSDEYIRMNKEVLAAAGVK